VATKSASQIIINIGYPCLLFSKIVPAPLSGSNISALGKSTTNEIHASEPTFFYQGPLVVIALVYHIVGGLLGFIVKKLFWVPHRFRYGIIIAGSFGNVGDLREHLPSLTLKAIVTHVK